MSVVYWLLMDKKNSEALKEIRRYKKRVITRNYNLRIRLATLEILGNECVKCGFKDKRALQVDHINGGGGAERKKCKQFFGKYILEEILAGKKKYQLLCANCNWIKKVENNETTIIKNKRMT